MQITQSLQIEHQLLRQMMEAMSRWLVEGVEAAKLRERAVMLEVAIEDHAAREEEQLFTPLAACSTQARELIGLMEMVHVEVHDLFEQVQDLARDPKPQLWTILTLTDEHLRRKKPASSRWRNVCWALSFWKCRTSLDLRRQQLRALYANHSQYPRPCKNLPLGIIPAQISGRIVSMTRFAYPS